MADVSTLGKTLQTFGPWVAAWATFCMALVHWWRLRNERQRDQATEKSSDWGRLRTEIERLDERCDVLLGRCDALQQKVNECEAREGVWMHRAIAAEAALLGQGEARQQAATIVATERLKDRENGK